MKESLKYILAIETSCDDTSVAIVDSDHRVIAMKAAHQIEEHSPFGGVVPEIASRSHLETLIPLIDYVMNESQMSWKRIDAIAVTSEPGLLGALLVGVTTAKTLSLAKNLPLIAVNHLEGHIFAPFLRDETYEPAFEFNKPFVALAVSGGHTSIYHVLAPFKYKRMGHTIDDAAGEAFDKLAKTLKLGFPGGMYVDKAAKNGNSSAYSFPRALREKGNLDLSFSGLKTAALNLINQLKPDLSDQVISDICASYQEAVADSLLMKLERSLEKTNSDRLVITGGVSANSRLRERAEELAQKKGILIAIPPLRYCTDNAAMIGIVGQLKLRDNLISNLSLTPQPKSTLFNNHAV